jgi:hypothetical protein
MAEAFVRTLKRDYVEANPKPVAPVIRALPAWFDHYNELHPYPRARILFSARVHRRKSSPHRVDTVPGN